MMGAHHAMTGAAAWIAVTATAGHGLGLFPVTPTGTILGALLCAGAALLPDADHGSATIAQSVPVLGKFVTSGISRASGGHRHGLHSLLAVACMWILATGLGLLIWQPSGWPQPISAGPAVMTAITVAFAAKALRIARWWSLAWLIGIVVATFIALFAPEQQAWFVICISLGYAVHLLGDFLTTGGLPLLWPFMPKPPRFWRRTPVIRRLWTSGGYLALPVLGNAGSVREWVVLIPVSLYAAYGVAFAAFTAANLNLPELLGR